MNIYKEMTSMTGNMTDENCKNFAFYLYTFDDKFWRIANVIEEYSDLVSEIIDESWELCNTIQSNLEFILAWYTFKYISIEYEETELTEEQWQRISDGLATFTVADDLVSLEQTIDSCMEA